MAVLLWGLAFGSYVRTASHPFVWDDFPMVAQNMALRSWNRLPSYFYDKTTFSGGRFSDVFYYRPLRNISFLLDFKLFHLSPVFCHVENALWHSLNTLFLFAILLRIWRILDLSPSLIVPWFAAALWALHPVNTEVVVWVKERDDLMCGFFFFAALLTYLRADLGKLISFPRAIAIALLQVLAMLCKETAIMFPLVLFAWIFLVEWTTKPRTQILLVTFGSRLPLLASLFAVSATFVALRDHVLGRMSQRDYIAGSFLSMQATMVRAMLRYVQLSIWPIWPTRLVADYNGYPVSTSFADVRVLTALVIIAGIVAVVVALGRRNRLVLFGAAFYVLCLLPVLNFVPTMQVMAERFLYLPLAGFVMGFGALISQMVNRTSPRFRPAIWTALGLYTLVILGSQQSRIATWSSALSIYRDTYLKNPGDWRPAANYAEALNGAGEWAEAARIAEKYVQKHPQAAVFHTIRGVAMRQGGELQQASEELRSAATLDPGDARTWNELATLALGRDELTTALVYFRKAAAADSSNADVWYNIALASYNMRRYPDALEAVQKAAAIAPGLPRLDDLQKAITTSAVLSTKPAKNSGLGDSRKP